MKQFKVIILPSAEQDISDAHEWIAERNPQAANIWHNRLLKVTDSLSSSPERCPIAPEANFFNTEIRQILYGRRHHQYRILFAISGDTVYVLHIRHGARLRLGEDNPVEE